MTLSRPQESDEVLDEDFSSNGPQRKDTENTETSLSTMTEAQDASERGVMDGDGDPTSSFETEAFVTALSSPAVGSFSPSVATSNNGLGLSRAIERARALNRSGRCSVLLLTTVANLYEPYSQSMIKAAQALQPALANQQLHGHIVSLQESTSSLSSELSKVTQLLRSLCGQSLQSYLVAHSDTLQGVSHRYRTQRDSCVEARQRALTARNKYQRVQQNLPAQSADDGDGPSASLDASDRSMSKRTAGKLKALQKEESRFKALVSEENESVKCCQRLEIMALESLELLEHDCVSILQDAFTKILEAERECLASMAFELKQSDDAGDGNSTASGGQLAESKKARKPFGKLLSKGSSKDLTQYEAGMGLMDAETLGLPEEVGKLRDRAKLEILNLGNRVQLVRSMATFLEGVASASAKLGLGLRQALNASNESKTTATDGNVSKGPETTGFEGFATLQGWNSISETLELEAEGLLALASSLRNTRAERLDHVLLSADKAQRTASDTEDNLWRQLCDSARAQSRAENRYRNSISQTARARERVKSVDTDVDGKKNNQMHKHVTKSIANVFSILPDGGEKALKILAPGARASIAQHTLDDADNKEIKEKQLLDSAVETTARALEAYKGNAENLLTNFENQNKVGWEDIQSVSETFIAEVDSLRSSRRELMARPPALHSSPLGLQQWIQTTKREIQIKADTAGEDAVVDFMLPEELDETADSSANVADDTETEGVDEASIESTSNTDAAIQAENASETGDPSSGDATWLKLGIPLSPSNTKSKTTDKGLGQSPSRQADDALDMDTEIFLSSFWNEPVERDSVPLVEQSFSCSYRNETQRYPFNYGRLFLTSERFIFASWSGRRQSLRWPDVLAIEPTREGLNHSEDALKLRYRKDADEESCTSLGGLSLVRNRALELMNQLREEANSKLPAPSPVADVVEQAKEVTVVPPDETLQKMEVVHGHHIRNISIQQFFDIAWSEGEGTDCKPLYRPWLERACLDLNMGTWEDGGFTGPWCKEQYTKKRVIKFNVKRKTHLYIGPPIAKVTQTHMCRLEGNDKCVLNMTCEFDGIPYSDTFAVEVRWVARREGANDLFVEIGLFVDFRKPVSFLLKPTIRSGTIEESTPIQKNLFKNIMEACVEVSGQDVATEEDAVVEESPAASKTENVPTASGGSGSLLDSLPVSRNTALAIGAVSVAVFLWFVVLRGSSGSNDAAELRALAHRMDSLEKEVKAVHQTLNEILELMREERGNQ